LAKDKFHSVGMSDHHIDDAENQVFRDKRNAFQKTRDFLKGENLSAALFVVGVMILGVYGMTLFIPQLNILLLKAHMNILVDILLIPASIFMFMKGFNNHPEYPFITPPWVDKNYEKTNPDKRGWFILGNSRKYGTVAAASKADFLTHCLIFGATGSGKSETLFTFVNNCLMQGSGTLLIDGKADANLPINVFTICRRLGREIDIFIMSYIKGSEDMRDTRTPLRRSNTINPIAKGGHATNSELTISLLAETGGDNAIFGERAEIFIKGYMTIATYLRDTGRRMPYMSSFNDEMSSLSKLSKMATDTTIPEQVRKPLKAYLETLGESMVNYMKNPNMQVPQEAIKQHGFISMQVAKPVSLMGNEYGHIFNVQYSDIDTNDVLVNRRILITLIPALEKSEQSIQSLGKVVVATIKILLAQIMDGSNLTGSVEDIVGKRATRSATPFIGILDEAGYYMSSGVAVIPAQARSIGMGFVFAGQDRPAFDKLVDTETDSIIGNTTIKSCGYIEDVEKTADLFIKRAGKAYISKTTGAKNAESMAGNMIDEGASQVDTEDRLDIRDLTKQNAGEFMFMRKDDFDFIKVMYAFHGISKIKHIQIHDFIPMPPWAEDDVRDALKQQSRKGKRFTELLKQHGVKKNIDVIRIFDDECHTEDDIIKQLVKSKCVVDEQDDGKAKLVSSLAQSSKMMPPRRRKNVVPRHRPGAKQGRNDKENLNIFDIPEDPYSQAEMSDDLEHLASVMEDITEDDRSKGTKAVHDTIEDINSVAEYPDADVKREMDNPEEKDEFVSALMDEIGSKLKGQSKKSDDSKKDDKTDADNLMNNEILGVLSVTDADAFDDEEDDDSGDEDE